MTKDRERSDKELIEIGRKMYKDIDERAENSIRQYLECEALMNEFFREVDYCKNRCMGLIGCCGSNHHQKLLYGTEKWDFSFNPDDKNYLDTKSLRFERIFFNYEKIKLLAKKRREKYGQPESVKEATSENGGPCVYHKENGCVLKDHKSIACIHYICGYFEKHLKKEFGIDYYKPFMFVIAKILDEGPSSDDSEVTEDEIDDFKSQIKDMIEKVREKKSKT